jgi:hypothetical protein
MPKRTEVVVFNGIEFKRYPDDPRPSASRYYRPSAALIRRGVGPLHREVWKHHHGPIPEGHHIHHRDGDHLNNAVENLECLPASEHFAHHGRSERAREHLARIRPLAAAWHATPEAAEVASAQSKRLWASRQPVARACARCGKGYESTGMRAQYCSSACQQASRKAAGAYDEDRVCRQCGATFRINRFMKAQVCGRSCGGKARWANARRAAG